MSLLRDELDVMVANPPHEPMIVSCYYCGMTMWSCSETAKVDAKNNITCGCFYDTSSDEESEE